MWLLSRRVITLAELLGLPRAATALCSIRDSIDSPPFGNPEFARLERRAQAWESICAVDRFSSMLWSLPLATANYPLPKRPLLDSLGHVNKQAYLFSLAEVASRVLELDSMISARQPQSELFNAIMRTGHELRSLASFPGKEWWDVQSPTHFSIDGVPQYWHQYFTVRTHLQLALAYDGQNDQFAFNFVTCLNACQDLATRYLYLRPAAPAGFFANWVIDMQAFTSAVFLQLASYRISHNANPARLPHGFDVKFTSDLIDQLVNVMESTSKGSSGVEFAMQAASGIRSLDSLLQQPQMQESQRISLSLPLIGKIKISRTTNSKTESNTGQNTAQQTVAYAAYARPQSAAGHGGSFLDANATPLQHAYASDAIDLMESLSYSMEILESYPSLPCDGFLGDF